MSSQEMLTLTRRLEMLEALVLQIQRSISSTPVVANGPVSISSPLPSPALIVEPPDPTWIPILHTQVREVPPDHWVKPCGQVGVYLVQPPQEGVRAQLTQLRVLVPGETRWRAPTILDEPRCSSCVGLIDPFSNADLDYLSHMRPASDRKRSGKDRRLTVGSPGTVEGQADPFSILPGHTPDATRSVMQTLSTLEQVAKDAGL